MPSCVRKSEEIKKLCCYLRSSASAHCIQKRHSSIDGARDHSETFNSAVIRDCYNPVDLLYCLVFFLLYKSVALWIFNVTVTTTSLYVHVCISFKEISSQSSNKYSPFFNINYYVVPMKLWHEIFVLVLGKWCWQYLSSFDDFCIENFRWIFGKMWNLFTRMVWTSNVQDLNTIRF